MRSTDLVIVFSLPREPQRSKNHADQYRRLVRKLKDSGLNAVGKRGSRRGQILILVRCPEKMLDLLAKRDREYDFAHGIPIPNIIKPPDMTSAMRLRLVHSFVTCCTDEGGLGISPQSVQWDHVQAIFAVHDPEFDSSWLRSITSRTGGGTIHIDKVKDQYGEAVGLYFAFLSAYTKSLTIISIIGALFYLFGHSRYSPLYSIILLVWSSVFVEYWNICQRKISINWRTKGIYKVEKRRPQYNRDDPEDFWKHYSKKVTRIAASVSLSSLFIILLMVILSVLFILEAFLGILYTGPGSGFAQLLPTIAFSASVPIIIALYRLFAIYLADKENHTYGSTYDSSITIRRFAVAAISAYLGIFLSAFVYIPFGTEVLEMVHFHLHDGMSTFAHSSLHGFWERDFSKAALRLDPARLQRQMFTFTVTAQIGNALQELVVPYLYRAFLSFSSGGSIFADRKGTSSTSEEDQFLERVRKEVTTCLEYNLFDDYAELATQFGYVAIWSSIWPLAPALALLNNYLESRSDAFKLITHMRRPIPIRAESIGAWLDCLRCVTWIAAVVNTLLAYFFSSAGGNKVKPLWALFAALAGSHAYFLLQKVAKAFAERMFWKRSQEHKDLHTLERDGREIYLKALRSVEGYRDQGEGAEHDLGSFWSMDEGADEIIRGLQDS